MSCTNSPEAVKKLLENMQSDLRALSLECKKKFPPVKEAAESGIIKVKTIAARNTEILAELSDTLYPWRVFTVLTDMLFLAHH